MFGPISVMYKYIPVLACLRQDQIFTAQETDGRQL